MKVLQRLLWSAPVLLLTSLACGQTPEDTEKARGLTTGIPLVIAMTAIVVVVAVGLVVAAVGVERVMRSRKALEDAPPPAEEVEEEDEVVAGITVGRAPVPKWLYAAYVLIPVFAFAYVVSNVAVAPAEQPDATEAPVEPCTECEISAASLQFNTDELVVAAGEEITLTFNNEDVVVHDFTVWEDEGSASGAPRDDSAETTGNVNAGQTGRTSFAADDVTYFNCTIHPAMSGDIVAQ